jgi:hypothetical protein
MSIKTFTKTYKTAVPNFQSNVDVANLIAGEYDKAVKLGFATGVPPAGGPTAKYVSGNKQAMSVIMSKAMDLAQKAGINLSMEDLLPVALTAY